jgi:hypothetical protein
MVVLSFATRSWADRDGGQRRNGVNVIEATYGGITVPIFNDCPDIAPGNVTAPVHAACQGQKTCVFQVDQNVIGDPAFGCWKSFEVTYQCAMNRNETRTLFIPAYPHDGEDENQGGADNEFVTMECPIQ